MVQSQGMHRSVASKLSLQQSRVLCSEWPILHDASSNTMQCNAKIWDAKPHDVCVLCCVSQLRSVPSQIHRKHGNLFKRNSRSCLTTRKRRCDAMPKSWTIAVEIPCDMLLHSKKNHLQSRCRDVRHTGLVERSGGGLSVAVLQIWEIAWLC